MFAEACAPFAGVPSAATATIDVSVASTVPRVRSGNRPPAIDDCGSGRGRHAGEWRAGLCEHCQTLELHGANFGPTTQVLFPNRDNAGNEGVVAALLTAINADGTVAQVVVPDSAETGVVTVTPRRGQSGIQLVSGCDLSQRDAELHRYRDDDAAALYDGGLQSVDGRVVGIDNVRGDGCGKQPDLQRTTSKPAPRLNGPQRGRTIRCRHFHCALPGVQQRERHLDVDDAGGDQLHGPVRPLRPGFLGRLKHQCRSGLFQRLCRQHADLPRGLQQLHSHQRADLSFRACGNIPLQIVPVITSMSGQPGLETFFTLFGSGFMEGASTITVGGVVLNDRFKDA